MLAFLFNLIKYNRNENKQNGRTADSIEPNRLDTMLSLTFLYFT